MNHRSPIPRILIWLIAGLTIASSVHAQVSCRISSRFLARGEQALLEVAVIGSKPTKFPEIAPVRGVEIRPAGRGPQTQLISGRRIEHVFQYLLTSYEVGAHRIEPINIEVGSRTLTTDALDFSIFNPDELQWAEAVAGNTSFRYASTFKVLNTKPYVGEAVPVEVKIYVPRDLLVDDWGIPDFGRDGITAWRMQPRDLMNPINLLGTPYVSVAYPSTLSPTRTGEVTIGPAKIRLVTIQSVMDGILSRIAVESHLIVPQQKLTAKALPAGAPAGYNNAVGEFDIKVSTPEIDVREGDPIPIDIVVSGTGNLDTLNPPQPVNSMGWKVYEAARQQRGDERRELTGNTVFQQFMRPLEMKSGLPTFRLDYFNPKTESYEFAESESISLNMTAASGTAVAPVGPPPATHVPVEEMTDILGLIPNAPLTRTSDSGLSQWWIHSIGGLLALVLIAKGLWMRHAHRFQKNPELDKRSTELRGLEGRCKNDHEFLMAAGRFIERWLGNERSPDIQDILTERDSSCFSGNGPEEIKLPPQRRKAILKTLRQTISRCLIFAACLIGTVNQAHAEDAGKDATDAYHSARYDKAIETWLTAAPYDQLSADTLYHIGNACYRAGSPGDAALYYRRALARDATHHESRQNLRFIERKYGALTIQRPNYQHLLAKLPLDLWQATTWFGIWISLLAALVFFATRLNSRLRVPAVLAFVCGPIIATCSGLGWRYFPNDAAFAPIRHQAVITAQQVALHTEASRNSAEVIEAPPGSLCEIIHESGEWAYVAFATQTRGWLPRNSIRKIIPDKAPTPPKIRKPVADDSNA